MGNGTVFRINEPSVIHQVFDDEVVVVHLTTGAYHSLRGTAAQVLLRVVSGPSSFAEITSHLVERYDASSFIIEKDLASFLDGLANAEIIVQTTRDSAYSTQPSSSNGNHARSLYAPPIIESFDDLQQLVLLDPVHDVSAAGWPRAAVAQFMDGEFPLLRCGLAGASVIFERFDTETVAMNLATGSFHSLTGTAEAIFLLLPEQPTTWEIRDALVAHYRISASEAEPALDRYLQELEAAGLISRQFPLEERPQTLLVLQPTDPSAAYIKPALKSFEQLTMDTPGLYSAGKDIASDPFLRSPYKIRSRDLLYAASSKEIVVCDRHNGVYFKLNETASDIFRLLNHGSTSDAIVAALQSKYSSQDHSLRTATIVFLSKLSIFNLLVPTATADTPQSTPLSKESLLPFCTPEIQAYNDLGDLLRPFNTSPSKSSTPKLASSRQVLHELKQYFNYAASKSGLETSCYTIAGKPVTVLGVPGDQLASVQRSLSHLRTDKNGSGLTIHFWSATERPENALLDLAISALQGDWSPICGPRGEVMALHSYPVTAIYHPGPNVLSVTDVESGEAFYLCNDEAALPYWELSSPFRHIFHPWFASLGLQYTHTGAIGGPKGGILLAGKGGSGKSTTSLLCAAAGMSYAGDDYCLVDADASTVYSLYNTAKLKGHADLDRIPAMRGQAYNPDSFERGGVGKGTYLISDIWPDRVASSLPIRAILMPAVTTQQQTTIEPCSSADALLALAPSTVAQLAMANNADCDRLALLADRLPAFHLRLGTDLDRIPGLLRQFTG